jgi:hypothetical protein
MQSVNIYLFLLPSGEAVESQWASGDGSELSRAAVRALRRGRIDRLRKKLRPN